MNISNIDSIKNGFAVLQTTRRSQTAMMVLGPGGSSSEEMNTHAKSDQVLLVLEGKLRAEVAGEEILIHKGDVCLVPAGTPHRFENHGKGRAVTFNVYSPPEYPADEED